MKNASLPIRNFNAHPKKIGIIANCQSQTLSVLVQLMLPECTITSLDLSSPRSREDAFRKEICDQMSNNDFVFVQPHDLTYSKEGDMRQSCKGHIVRIANLFFRGLHPDMCMLGDFTNRVNIFSKNHSIIILDAYLRGLSVKQASEAFNSDNYKRLGLFAAWDLSLSEMRHRDSAVDFPATRLIEESVQNYQAFLTMNHPSIRLLHAYFSSVLNGLGIRHTEIDVTKVKDPMDVHDIAGVFSIICDHYNSHIKQTILGVLTISIVDI